MMLAFDGRRHGNNITKAFDGRRLRYMITAATNAPYGSEPATKAVKYGQHRYDIRYPTVYNEPLRHVSNLAITSDHQRLSATGVLYETGMAWMAWMAWVA